MERGTEVKIPELKIGERYCLNKSMEFIYSFVVTSIDADIIAISFRDGIQGIYYTHDTGTVYYNPLTSLEKVLL